MAGRDEHADSSCPSCGEPVADGELQCSICGETLLTEPEFDELVEQLDTPVAGEPVTAPRWAVLLTGLALGIAIAPLVVYAVVIAAGQQPLWRLALLLAAGWLGPAVYLSRLPNPSAALSRGLYLVVVGIGAVLVALVIDASTPGSTVATDQLELIVGLLALPAIIAVVLARRIASRAARQARGEPGWLHPDDESEDGGDA